MNPALFFIRLILIGFLSASLRAADSSVAPIPTAKGGEPTNATEAATKKSAEDRSTAEAFQKWKATLSPEQQAWEAVLEQNLGSFYLPIYQREKLAGKETAWDFVADDPKLPRVLLVGDSISRGYTLAVRHALAGKANVHRAPENCGPTANGLKKLAVWLGSGKWDLVHFNFGIHDRETPLADYEQRLDEIAVRLEATGAVLVWASSTPLPAKSTYGANDAIITRNEIAARLMTKHRIPVDDLYAEIAPRLAEFQLPNDVHFKGAGYDFLGQKVAAEIINALNAQRKQPAVHSQP